MFKFIKNTIKKAFGTKYDRDEKHYMPFVNQVNAEFEQLADYSNDELRGRTLDFKARIAEHLAGIDEDIQAIKEQAKAESNLQEKEALFKELDKEILPAAFAVVKETARRFSNNEELVATVTEHDRNLAGDPKKNYLSIQGEQVAWKNTWMAAGGEITWNMVHYDVQLIGGMVLHDGKVAEMATGEGKTLVATLPAYLNGLSKAAYNCDITYGTNNEFGFDYLRDNMVRSEDEMVQRKHHFTMIDEVDSVLIDDARTPLIISGPVPKGFSRC